MNDVSAVADPYTGEGIFLAGGFYQAGGTSLAAPLIGAVYAQSGNMPPGILSNSLSYMKPSALNAITSGSNGTCSLTYLCNAVAGYNGPTGLGTPNGVGAF